MDLAIRPASASDLAYVHATWLRSYWARPLMVAGREVSRAVGKRHHGERLLAILPELDIRIAHLPDDQDAILGWAASSGMALYYAYVRDGARRQGIARRLVEGHGFTLFTHSTPDAPYVLRAAGPLQYDPFVWWERRWPHAA